MAVTVYRPEYILEDVIMLVTISQMADTVYVLECTGRMSVYLSIYHLADTMYRPNRTGRMQMGFSIS